MTYSMSFRTQYCAVAYCDAQIKGLASKKPDDTICSWQRYQRDCDSLTPLFQRVCKQSCPKLEERISGLQHRFALLKSGFEQQCVDGFTIRLSKFTTFILGDDKDDGFFLEFHMKISADVENFQAQMRFFFTYFSLLHRTNLRTAQRTLSHVIRSIHARFEPHGLKLKEGGRPPALFNGGLRFTSLTAERLYRSFLESEIVDLLNAIKGDPAPCLLTYFSHIRQLGDEVHSRRAIETSSEYQTHVQRLREWYLSAQRILEEGSFEGIRATLNWVNSKLIRYHKCYRIGSVLAQLRGRILLLMRLASPPMQIKLQDLVNKRWKGITNKLDWELLNTTERCLEFAEQKGFYITHQQINKLKANIHVLSVRQFSSELDVKAQSLKKRGLVVITQNWIAQSYDSTRGDSCFSRTDSGPPKPRLRGFG